MIQTFLPQDIVLCDYETYLKKHEESPGDPFRNPFMYLF